MFKNVHTGVNHKQHQGHSSISATGVNSDLVHTMIKDNQTVTLDEEVQCKDCN
jgi:hypothetical protein